MSLSEAQKSARNEIYNYGKENDFSDGDIQIALDVAYIESSVGDNLINGKTSATGLFQYIDATWNNIHGGLGSKDDQGNQIQAFYNDLITYRDWHYSPATNGNIPSSISFDEYVYIKHHDGRSETDFLNAEGLVIYNDRMANGPLEQFDVSVDDSIEGSLIADSSIYVDDGCARSLDPVGCIKVDEDGHVCIDYFLEYSLTPEERQAIVDANEGFCIR